MKQYAAHACGIRKIIIQYKILFCIQLVFQNGIHNLQLIKEFKDI